MIKDFRDLQVWQKGMEIVQLVYNITRLFPQNETYVLVAQARRAAISLPLNIAEGFNRRHRNEYRQHLYVALGSCAELESCVEIAFAQGYIKAPEKELALANIQSESKMLNKFISRMT